MYTVYIIQLIERKFWLCLTNPRGRMNNHILDWIKFSITFNDYVGRENGERCVNRRTGVQYQYIQAKFMLWIWWICRILHSFIIIFATETNVGQFFKCMSLREADTWWLYSCLISLAVTVPWNSICKQQNLNLGILMAIQTINGLA